MELVQKALTKGAKLYASVSGGKDGQAMVKSLRIWGYPLEAMIHADLGRVEWAQSLTMCLQQSLELNIPLEVVKRSDGLDLLAYWARRMNKLMGENKPFWSSAQNRYSTSDLKREPINKFFRRRENFIISCEGIRAEESPARAKKEPLSIRPNITSTYYKGMTVEQAIENYNPKKRLALTWFPIFNYTIDDVWSMYGTDATGLRIARLYYSKYSSVPVWWPFHPAYAMGNDRVSCMFCVLGSLNDLQNAARHNPKLLNEMIDMEDQSGFTFKNKWSLKNLINGDSN
jgi:3'-phosphoadenosine 5'-phosphosulfate sulfotransferase (PAPS reductase)/FAD synthetase